MSYLGNIQAITNGLAMRLAISVQAIEAAVFTLDPDSANLDPLSLLIHIHHPVNSHERIETALSGFRHFVWTAIRNDIHMVFPMDPPVFGLAALIRRDARVCGAFAAAIRANDGTDANRRLALLIRVLSPPPAGNPKDLRAVMHHLAEKVTSSVQAHESILFLVEQDLASGEKLSVLTHVGRSTPDRKAWAVDICEQAVKHALSINRPGAYKIWEALFCLVSLICTENRVCGAFAVVIRTDEDADANSRLRKLTGPIAGVAPDADLIVRPLRLPPPSGPGHIDGTALN